MFNSKPTHSQQYHKHNAALSLGFCNTCSFSNRISSTIGFCMESRHLPLSQSTLISQKKGLQWVCFSHIVGGIMISLQGVPPHVHSENTGTTLHTHIIRTHHEPWCSLDFVKRFLRNIARISCTWGTVM